MAAFLLFATRMNMVVPRGENMPRLLAGFIRVFAITLWISLCASASAQDKATLAWNPSPDGLAVGYFIYYGPASQFYTNKIDVGTNLSWTVGGLDLGTNYFFAVSSYTPNGTESDLSGEVAFQTTPFFTGQFDLGNNIEFLTFKNGTVFGFYSTDSYPWIYHFDLGFEYVFDGHDQQNSVYLYDWSSGSFWYTTPALFPYIYDFSLGSWLYYYSDSQRPDHYTSNPRYFYETRTGKIITK